MKTFRNILLLLLLFCGSTLYLPAAGPLKKPLHFVPSDSVIVWGGDRSDIRATALAASPSLKCRETTLSPADMAQAKHTIKSWEKDILPELNPLGGLGEAYDDSRVLELSKMLTLGGKLFLLTADAQYMNVVERASLNALLHMLRPGDMNFEKHTAAQALINASGMFYAYDDEGVFVNLYVNSSTHIAYRDFPRDNTPSRWHFGFRTGPWEAFPKKCLSCSKACRHTCLPFMSTAERKPTRWKTDTWSSAGNGTVATKSFSTSPSARLPCAPHGTEKQKEQP